MSNIRVLPQDLINKIAAGEVVERPASVVKELIENSLDAQATRIVVTIEDGGKKLIAVSDNGTGMTPDDLQLAFASHATSKLTGPDDLFAISTMGFRGEALASVASISHAHIRTRRRGDDGGYELEASGETIQQVRPCAAATGTTVTIRDLFFNTPVRRKFMRSANTELSHVTEQLTRLAIPNPQVGFTLTHNGREIKNLPVADTTAQRVCDLFGAELGGALLSLTPRKGLVGVAGLIAAPAAGRASSRWQYVFLNGRYIRDRSIAHAIREGFRGLIEPSKFPVAFIFLELPPGEVDVNVHPTKIEVRFRNGQLVHGELLGALKETLNKANLTPEVSLAGAVQETAEPGSADKSDPADRQRRDSLREAMADFFKATPPKQPRFSFPEYHRRTEGNGQGSSPPHPTSAAKVYAPQQAAETFSPSAPKQSARTTRPIAGGPPAAGNAARAIQIHNSYIVAPCQDGVLIIDQHALHERVLYNEFKDRLTGCDGGAGKLTAQRMLIPERLEITPGEYEILETHAELLKSLGIEISSFGPTSVAIQQFPTLLVQRGVAAGEFLRGIIDKLAEDQAPDPERLLEDLLEMMACKAAVKAGDPLTCEEIDLLLVCGENTEKSSACPHGRPTTIKLTLKDLEKQFKRT